jgi:hypothetical protein
MKVFFADDIDDMIAELVSQAAKTVRLQVLKKAEGNALLLKTYVTAYCNGMVYEAILTERHSLADVPADQIVAFAQEKAAELREKFAAEHLRRFEIKPGIYQGP